MSRGASKRSVAIAFGGGSVGNLVGLAAALLFRGIRYVEVPTSFMHMTDGVRLDYLDLRDAETLQPLDEFVTRPAVMAVAAFVGKTRLIDNQLLTP